MNRLLLLSLLSAHIALGPVVAQTTLYRWVDDQGNVHYSDKVPPDHSDQARAALNRQGMVVDSVEAAPTPEQIAAARARAAAQAQVLREQQAQERLDAVLLNSYGNVEAIERARQDEIRALQRTVDMNLTAVEARRQQLHHLVGRAAELQRAGRPVTDSLVNNMQGARAELNELHAYIDEKRAEQAEIFATYEQRIKRFRELTKSGP